MNVKVDSLSNSVLVFKTRIKRQFHAFQKPFSERKAILISADGLLVCLAVWGALLLCNGTYSLNPVDIRSCWYWFPILMGGWWVVAWLGDLYHIPSSVHKVLTAARVAIVGALGLVIYLSILLLSPQSLPPLFFFYFLLVILPSIILWRWIYASVFQFMLIQHRVLIVGGGERARAIAEALSQTPRVNYRVLGYVSEEGGLRARAMVANALSQTSQMNYRVLSYVEDGPATQVKILHGLPVLGRTVDLPRLVTQLQVQEVVVATERSVDKDLFELLVECYGHGVQVSQMPDLYEKFRRSIPIQHIDPMWALSVMQNLPCRLELAIKRLLDLSLGLIGLLVLTAVLPLVALAIYLDSPGPIFYRQVRSGRSGRTFSIVKFRTMFLDAERDGKPRWATKDDCRITRVGRFLRKTRLDELPQIFNVLRGEMSIVGPRPERPEFIEQLQQEIPFYRTRLMVKPGLTGWAQIHYSYGNCVEDALIKLQFDFYYLRYWSVWQDFYIIFRTLGVMLNFQGT